MMNTTGNVVTSFAANAALVVAEIATDAVPTDQIVQGAETIGLIGIVNCRIGYRINYYLIAFF